MLPGLTGGAPLVSRTVRINRGEGDIAGPLGQLVQHYATLSFGSYPFIENGAFGVNIVIRGTDVALLDNATRALQDQFKEAT